MEQQTHRLDRRSQPSGFTLVELMIVLAVIAILGAVVVPSLKAYREKAQISNAEEAGRQIFNAFSAFAASSNGNCYPGQIHNFNDVVRIAGENGVRLTAAQQSLFQKPGESPIQVQYRCLLCNDDLTVCVEFPCPDFGTPGPITDPLGPANFALSIPIQGIDRPAGQELFLTIHSVEGVKVQTGPLVIPAGP
jgi:prepilin-type N-terminal cleavage/methylation domain-containing protein